MRKNQYSKRTDGAYVGKTPRNERYAHLSASGRRDGDDSGHSFRELATASTSKKRQVGKRFDPKQNRSSGSSRRRKKKANWYAIADPHQPTWGVYTDWDVVKALKPGRVQGFQTEHEARQWLEDIDYGRIDPPGAKKSRRKHAGANARPATNRKPSDPWYAVVRGYVPGVYAEWTDAWTQTNGFHDSRPYKARSRQEACEIFMRWSGGAQLYPASSTMSQRGEVIGEYADAFLGLEGAEVIRKRAFAKHARDRRLKFKETGDPIWDTSTPASREARPVEVTLNVATPKGPKSKQRSRSDTGYHATSASWEKVAGGESGDATSSTARTGMGASASAERPTTRPKPSVGAHKGGIHSRVESESTATLNSPRGAGKQETDSNAPRSSIVTGEAHQVHSPVEQWGVGVSQPGLNSGAVEHAEVQYAGKDNSSISDESLLQKMTSSSETRGPPGGERRLPTATQSRGKRSDEGGYGKHAAMPHSSDTSDGEQLGHDQKQTLAHTQTRVPKDRSDSGTGTSTESDRARARALFRSSDSAVSTTSPEEIKSAAAAIRTLESWGFSAISKSDAEKQKQRDLQEWNERYGSEKSTATATKAKPATLSTKIPRKKHLRASTSGVGKEAPVPVPVPVQPKTTPARRPHGGRRDRQREHRDGPSHARKPKAEMSKQELRRIIKRRERALAEAVLRARDNENAEEDMMRRVLGHMDQPEQKYRHRLRSAEYFEYSSDSDRRHSTRHIHDAFESDDESLNDNPRDDEPQRKNDKVVIRELTAKIHEHERESAEMRKKMNDLMSMLVDLRNDIKTKKGRTRQEKQSPRATSDADNTQKETRAEQSNPTHASTGRSATTGADGDANSTSSHTTIDSAFVRSGTGAEEGENSDDHAGQAGETAASESSEEVQTRTSRHKRARGRPVIAPSSSSSNDTPVESVGPRIPTPSAPSSSASSVLSARHEEEAVASATPGYAGGVADADAVPTQCDESKKGNAQEVVDLTESEPSAEPPVLPDGTLGLQQLLIGSKTLKVLTMDKLYSANSDAIMEWRIKRKRYLKQVAAHNSANAIKLDTRPVRDFVDEVIWNAVSKKKLKAEHRTVKGAPANHVQCAAYFTGTGAYKGHIVMVSTDAMQVLKNVKYQKGRQGATHEDRWFSFTSRRDKALEKIPAAQQNNIRFREAHARYLRSAVRPKSLRDHVANAYSSGIHPGTKVFTPWWMLETKKDVDKTEEMIESIIEYMDARQREGLGDHTWDEAPQPSSSSTTREVCNNWRSGKCTKGDKCPRKHVGASGAGATPPKRTDGKGATRSERQIGPDNVRCDKDKLGQKCAYGEKCYFAHRHGINPRKDAAPRTPPKDYSDKVCNGCGEKGHIAWKCKKLKQYEAEIKAAIGYTGDPKWLMDPANSKKCIELFRNKQWFAATVHHPMPKPSSPEEDSGGAKQNYKLPYKIERNLIDAGWCWLGWGSNRIQLRLYVDLGATCSFSTQGVYNEIAPKAADGSLGCARVAPEIQHIAANGWDGKNKRMKYWMQMTVTADNVQGVQTICVGQYISFDRVGNERVLTAGKDLAKDLGFVHPTKQIEANRIQGVSPESLLGDETPKRTYVLSAEEKAKREDNRRRAAMCATVHADGLAYVGDEAFKHVRPMEWTQEPLLQHSYITTAALHQAGISAKHLPHDGVINELVVQGFSNLQDWLAGHTDTDIKGVHGLVTVDVLRVTSETHRLTRILDASFIVIESTAKRIILGNDVLLELQRQYEDEPDPFQSDIDFDEEAQIRNTLEAVFDEARVNGLPKKHWKRYRKLIFETYFFVFRLRLGREDPAILPPLNVKTYPGAKMRKGYKIGFDKLSQAQLDAMETELKRMKSMGVVTDAPLWATLHSLLTLAKTDGSSRFVITCITANDITVDYWWDSPDNANSQQQRMHGMRYFWVADLLKGYWQVQLHKDCQWMYCFGTPWGPMMYLRAPMGCKAVGPWFDMCCARILEAANLLHKGVEMIHDDHAGGSAEIYNEDAEGNSHFHLLRRYLKVCAQHRIRISPKKFVLFTSKMDFGGVMHHDSGMRPSPPRYQALLEQPEPKTLDEVYSGMCSTGWSRTFIPNFAVLEQPIRTYVMKRLGSGKKSIQRAKRMLLAKDEGWTEELRKAYLKLKYALILAIKRAYRDPKKIACLLWDASKFAWSYTITQVAPEELAKAWTEQIHEILVTRSGLFKGRQVDWDMGCKEAYPPTRAQEVDAQFLEGEHPFMAAGDHRNIMYIMSKDHRPPVLKTTSHDRLNRWCLRWKHTNFQIYHVPGVMNTFNDFHTRAGAPEAGPFYTLQQHAERLEAKLNALKREIGVDAGESEEVQEASVRQHLLITEPVLEPSTKLAKHEKNLVGESLLPYLAPEDWPNATSIAAAQQAIPQRARNTLRAMQTATAGISLLVNSDGKIVIPQEDKSIIAAICATAHQGRHGHHTGKQMRKHIETCFWWAGMAKDIQWWADHCLQCIKLAGGAVITRPLGYQLRATQPMEVISLDYMDMPKAAKEYGFTAILVIVDQLTRICICVPTKDKTAATAAQILVGRWLSFFPDPAFLVSDGGTHFNCELFRQIAAIRGFQHHITAPYSQWANAAERLNQELLKGFKQILHTTDTEIKHWPKWAAAIQECLNKQLPVSSRDNRTPMELLTGLAPRTAIQHIAWLGVEAVQAAPISDEELRAPLANVHEAMRGYWTQAVQSQVDRAAKNKKRDKGVVPRINVGDMVLIAEAVRENKLQMKWTGPHQVMTTISPYVYEVLPMLRVPSRRRPKKVHIVRIRRFSAGALGTDADREAIQAAALRDYPDNVVQRFVSHNFGPAPECQLMLRVRWLGYDAAHDTHEPVTNLIEDVPDLVEAYLRKHPDDRACTRMLRRFFR